MNNHRSDVVTSARPEQSTLGRGKPLALVCKRALDVGVAASALFFLLPLLLGVSVAIGTSDRGPVLVRQTRIGRRGRPFTLYQFRIRDTWGSVFISAGLNELPQLFNVLCGDMSLVGPRAIISEEMARYGQRLEDYLTMRPGLTGPSQVQAWGCSWTIRMALDARYAAEWSLKGDLVILGRSMTKALRDH